MRLLTILIPCLLIVLTASPTAQAVLINSHASASQSLTVTGMTGSPYEVFVDVFVAELFPEGLGDATTSASVSAGGTALGLGEYGQLGVGETLSTSLSADAQRSTLGDSFAAVTAYVDVYLYSFASYDVDVTLSLDSASASASVSGTALPWTVGSAFAYTNLDRLDGGPTIDPLPWSMLAEVPPGADSSEWMFTPLGPTITVTLAPNDFVWLGFDSFVFAEAAAVPEPGSFAVWSVFTLACVGAWWRRRRTVGRAA